MQLRLTAQIVKQLAGLSQSDSDRVYDKLEEYSSKPELLDANVKTEQSKFCKDFSKQHKLRIGHFRIGDWRVLGLLDKETFRAVCIIHRSDLDKELARIVKRFPFDID